MMRRFLNLLPILMAMSVFYLTVPLYHHNEPQAQMLAIPGFGDPNLGTTDENGDRISCSELPEAKGGVLLGTIVPCISFTIEGTTQKFAKEMIDRLEPLLWAFITLVTTLFGVRVLQGERQLNAHALLLLLKIMLVLAFLKMIPNTLVPLTYDMINEGIAITTTVVGPDDSKINCEIDKYGDDQTPLVWKQMDCVIGKLFGFITGTGNTGPGGKKPVNMVLTASAIGLLSGFFFGGTIGVAVFFALLGVLWSIIMVVIRMVMAFLNGYLTVCVMLLIAPIFMPLTLLKVTSDYFEKWWKAILGGMIMPVLISAYSMFALLMYDKVLFADDSLLQKLFENKMIAGQISQASTDPATQNSRTPCDFNVTNEADFKGDPNSPQGQMDQILKNPYLQNFTQPLLSAGSDACGMFRAPVFDVTKVGADPITGEEDPRFKDAKKAMEELFIESITLFILAYLIGAGLKSVEGMVSSFAGSSSAAAAFSPSPGERKLGNVFNSMGSNLSRQFAAGSAVQDKDGNFGKESDTGGLRGKDFLNKIGDMTKGNLLGTTRDE